jgi:hypothetical protein
MTDDSVCVDKGVSCQRNAIATAVVALMHVQVSSGVWEVVHERME